MGAVPIGHFLFDTLLWGVVMILFIGHIFPRHWFFGLQCFPYLKFESVDIVILTRWPEKVVLPSSVNGLISKSFHPPQLRIHSWDFKLKFGLIQRWILKFFPPLHYLHFLFQNFVSVGIYCISQQSLYNANVYFGFILFSKDLFWVMRQQKVSQHFGQHNQSKIKIFILLKVLEVGDTVLCL